MSELSDPNDFASEMEAKWLEAQLSEHQHKLNQAGNDWPYGIGRCKNCGDQIDDGRPYCEEACRDDHWDRIKASLRDRKYRG